jgi:hypothetical protein
MELKELGDFKTGQVVVYESGIGVGATKSLVKIDRITDQWGGTIYVGKQKFASMGGLRSSNAWSTASITPATDALKIQIAGDRARNFLRDQKFQDYSDNDAVKAATFIRDQVLKKAKGGGSATCQTTE